MKMYFAVGLAALSAMVGWSQSSPRQSQTLPELQHIDVMQVDNAVDPCGNFYQYACGKLSAANPIPPDQMSWGPDGLLTEWNRLVLRQILEKNQAVSASRTEDWRLLRNLHRSGGLQGRRSCGDPAAAPAHRQHPREARDRRGAGRAA
jgi:endothelin-converting enzyme/putative endopeptidase